MTHLYCPSLLGRTAGSAWMKSAYWQIMDLVGQAIGISPLGKEECFRKSETMKRPPLVKGSTQPLDAIQLMGNNAAGSPLTLELAFGDICEWYLYHLSRRGTRSHPAQQPPGFTSYLQISNGVWQWLSLTSSDVRVVRKV